MHSYKDGNIISLTLINFQTFKNTTISFSPTLNFILGPNGSGKSTISNALSFIFGGNPKTIGKAKQLKEYIRFGEEKCKIEAKIFFKNEIVSLIRSMSHSTNSYYLNQNCVKKSVYDDFIDKLKININNLCQYLPQEKVSEFSRMTPEDLLVQTCISLDKNSLIENLNEIKENEYKLFEFVNKENVMRIEKNNIKNFVDNIYKDVEKIKEKERKTLRIEMMEIKKIWLEYENMKKDYKRLINNLKILKKSFKENNLESEEIKKEIEKIKKSPLNLEMIKKIKNLEKWDNELKEKIEKFKEKKHKEVYLEADIENLEKRKEKNKKESEKIKEEIERDKEGLMGERDKIEEGLLKGGLMGGSTLGEDSIRGSGNKKKKIEDKIEKIMRRIREGCEYECKEGYEDGGKEDKEDGGNLTDNHNTNLLSTNLPNNLPHNNPPFINIDDLLTPYDSTSLDHDSNLYFDLNRKKQQIMNNSIEIKSKFDSLEDKKKKINEEGERRLELLKRYHLDTYNAVIWLRDNKSLFSKEIIEPTFLHLNITNEKFTPEIEVFLSFILMTSFICKDPNDFIKFMKKMKDEKNLRINAIEEIKGYNTDGGSKVGKGNSNLTNNNNNTLFKSLGFDGVILDFINVRNETKDFLIAHGHFDSIPLTKSLLNDKNIFEKSSIKRFAMNSKFFEIKRSRYNDKDFIIHSSSINPKNLFTKKIDTTEIENELKKLDFDRKINEMDLNKILNEIEDLNLKINIKKKEKNSFDKDLNFIKSKINLINMTLRTINQKKKRFKELENNEKNENEIKKIKNEITEIGREKIKLKNELIKIFRDEEYLKEFKNCMGLFKEINSEFKTLDFLENNLEIIKKNIKEIKNQIEKNEGIKSNLKKVMNEKKRKIMERDVGGSMMGSMMGDKGNDMDLDDKGDIEIVKDKVKDNDDTLNTTQIPQSLNNTLSLNTQMKSLPNTIEELNSEIIKEKTQLKFINVSEESKIEYENKKNQLDKILNELENTTNTKKSYEDRIKEIKEGVIKELINLTEKIDKEFQKLFKEMGCEGKIEFVYEKKNDDWNKVGGSKVRDKVGGSSKDYGNIGSSKVGDNHNLNDHSLNNINNSNNNNSSSPTLPCKNWKLNILVKFREKEKLEILSSFRQSGGEKSVSTILFLLALQKVDTSPCRLVDEINQGMDKDNEKSILNILFKMNLNEKTQFFIISPKLVEGLDYNENMKIIILFSDQPGAVKRAFLRGR